MIIRKAVLVIAVCVLTGPLAWGQDAYSTTNAADITVEEVLRRIEANQAELQRLQQQLSENRFQSASANSTDTEFQGRLARLETLLEDKKEEKKKEDCVDTHGEKFTVKLGGRVDYLATYGTDDGLTALGLPEFANGHEFRRARLHAEGEGFGIFDYKVEVDFAEFNNPVAKDVFMGAKLPIGRFRIGHFKEPFSLEELTSSNFVTFIERASINEMVPQRSAGFMLFNQTEDGMGFWAVGSFFDDLQQTTSTDADGEVQNQDNEFRSINARATRLLFYDEPSGGRYFAHIGGAFRHTEDENANLRFRARPEVHDTFRLLGVNTGPFDAYQQYGAEGALVWGSLSVQGEWVVTDISNADDSILQGGYAYVSYFLTGEHRPYRKDTAAFDRVTPLENFWWVKSDKAGCETGMGAWEVAFRWSNLDFDDTGLTSVGGANGIRGELDNYTTGVNWYWNPYMKLQFNWTHSELDPNAGDDADQDAFVTRFHVDF